MSSEIHMHLQFYDEHGTAYRVRPNPDCEEGDGSSGVVLDWKGEDDEEWNGYFFVGPNEISKMAECLHSFEKMRKK